MSTPRNVGAADRWPRDRGSAHGTSIFYDSDSADTVTVLAAEGRILIGGEWRPATSGATFTTYDPATAAPLGELAEAAPADVDAAVQAARRALP